MTATAPAHPLVERPVVCDTREEQYHLVVLDPTHTRILAARPARSWLLPYLRFRSQMPEALVFQPYLAQLGVEATPIHEAILRDGCGLDGDRTHRGVAHRYIALEAQKSDVHAERLSWEPLSELLGLDGSAILPIQEKALRTCLERFQSAVAPFDSPAQLRAARHWILCHLRGIAAEIAGEFTYYRISRFDMVMSFRTTKGLMYFKGGPRRMAHEAELTQALHALMPRHFPGTIAHDRERHWWLTPAASGADLTSAPASEDVWLAAVRLLATAQRKAMDSRRVCAALVHRRFGAPQFAAVSRRLQRMLADGPFLAHWPEDRIKALDERISQAVSRLLACDLPWTWTPTDFVGLNIFNDQGRLRFVGVEDSALAPPTLAVGRLFDDLRFRVRTPEPMIQQLSRAYIEAWHDALPAETLQRALADTPTCSLLLTFRTQLDRHARHHGLWTSEGEGLPASSELHEEAHRLGLALTPKAATAGSTRC